MSSARQREMFLAESTIVISYIYEKQRGLYYYYVEDYYNNLWLTCT